MFPRIISCTVALTITLAVVSHCDAQQPSPTPPNPASPKKSAEDQQEPIKILIEEVQIPVAAYDQYGHLDPTLQLTDLLVLENGIRQEARSLRRIPASVVLLLDTGGEINPAKNTRTTRAIASRLIETLAPADQVSIIQFNNKVELLQGWTSDRSRLTEVLNTKLLSGKRAALSPAIGAAVDQFRNQLVGSRHLVLITDGVESANTKSERAAAVSRLIESNAVLHVISYAAVSRVATKTARRVVTNRDKSTVPDDVINSLPPDDHGYDQLRALHKPGGKTIDLDPERRRLIEQYEEALREGEFLLTSLANETGGKVWLPESVDQMITDGASTARLIDSEYLITYKPSRPFESANRNESRRVEIVSRRIGLNVVARRSVVMVSQIGTR